MARHPRFVLVKSIESDPIDIFYQKNAATSMALRRLYFRKKVLWLPETIRHRLSASLIRSVSQRQSEFANANMILLIG